MSEITALDGTPVTGSGDKKRTISLEYDMRNGALKIDGQLDNMDLAINILEQAIRYLRNQQLAMTIIQAGQRLEQEHRLIQSATRQ